MPTSSPLINLNAVTKNYGHFLAVHGLNMSVNKGDIYGFLGPNGSGKSTTLRMMLSLIKPSSGEVQIFGRSLADHRSFILSRIGCIIEKPDFYGYLSAEKNLAVFAKLSGVSTSKKQVEEMLEFVGLGKRGKDPVKTYSHGMKQRLGLAQTLLHDPELIVLDEPNTGLDPVGIIELRNLLLFLNKEKGKTILLSSHVLSEIELIASRMIIINKGKSMVEGSVNELLNSEKLVVTFSFLPNDGVAQVLSESGWESKMISHNNKEMIVALSQEEVPLLNAYLVQKNISVTSIQSKRKLEDYFMKLVNSAN